MKENYIPGEGCMCHAHSESECACDVDWTPREVYELREQCSNLDDQVSAAMMVIRGLEQQRDRLAEALREIINEDYGGEQAIAHKALAALKGGEL